MQKDYRDVLEVAKFDLIEETVGSWLRAIIQRLEKEEPVFERITKAADPKARNIERNASPPEAPSEVCKAGVFDCDGPAVSSFDFGPIRF